MKIDSIEAFIYALNPFFIYGLTILLTLVVVLNRLRVVKLPRSLVVLSWYAVVVLALSWLLFHVVSLLNSGSQIVGLASIARMLQFVPIYICAVIVLFMYPKKKRTA